jgi:hypothetical protein
LRTATSPKIYRRSGKVRHEAHCEKANLSNDY